MQSPLLSYLKRHGITQAAFAQGTGWRQATISGWCNGVIPSIAHALQIERETNGEVTVKDWASYAKSNTCYPQDNTAARNAQARPSCPRTTAGDAA